MSKKQSRMKFPSVRMMRLSNKAGKSITENKLLGARYRLLNTGLEARQIISSADRETRLTSNSSRSASLNRRCPWSRVCFEGFFKG